MAEDQKKLLADFEQRMKQLIYLCDTLKEQNQTLREELVAKDSKIELMDAEMGQLKKQYDNLKFAKAFSSGNKDETKSAKQQLSKLVRDVDKCIALLKI